jgi:hypothetical protein
MKQYAFLAALFIQLISISNAQINDKDQFEAGVVYGPKGACKIAAPKNWVLDNVSGQSSGLPCVLYINGYTWENSPVIMYAKIASPTFTNIDKFIAFAIKEFKKEDPAFHYKEVKTGKLNGYKYVIMNYQCGPYNSYERVFYIQMKNAVGYVVFSARNEEDYKKYSDAIFEIVNSFRYKPEFINYKPK